jgi:Nif-specific regulatory protein
VVQLGNRWTDILRLQTNQVVSIGRSSENQVVVADDRVSRRHAEISHDRGGWQIADLGSRNGTQVAGESIAKSRTLLGGEVIIVGNCQMTFTYQLSEAFSQTSFVGQDSQATSQIDQDNGQATAIIGKLSQSQWSSSLPGSLSSSSSGGEKWGFFYRLIFELSGGATSDQAAGLALDHLLAELDITSGGVVLLDPPTRSKLPQQKQTAGADRQQDSRLSRTKQANGQADMTDFRLAVLAARQSPGGSYHRISDFLIRSVLQEGQAILARNVQDDGQLSLARGSGQQSTTSVIVVPLRTELSGQRSSEPYHVKQSEPQSGADVFGILHVYTRLDQRMLTTADLDLAVGVGDNLAIALSNLNGNQQVAEQLAASRRRVDQLEEQLKIDTEMVGGSKAIQHVRESILRAAPTTATVLIRGESGVGKELVARAIHLSSQRSSGPMVCLNCAALAPTLLESELFGHEKGAFTGATERKIGKFEAAHRGTLLLDEIGEMPLELQAKFLRVLEGHPFERLGGSTPIQTDVRIIAATNRNLEQAIDQKLFRSDLYYRLRVVEIPVPPLRERPEDIPELARHFLNLFSVHSSRKILGIEPSAMEVLVRHSWPGNIRELKNAIERSVVLGSDSTINASDLGLPVKALPEMPGSKPGQLGPNPPKFQCIALDDLERNHIMATLESVEGNKSKAAQLLGIERSTLDRKLKRYSTPD